MKFYIESVSSRPHLLHVNEGLDFIVARPPDDVPPDLLRSSIRRPVIIRLEVCPRSTSHYMASTDLQGHGILATGDLWSWQMTDRSGDKSQRRDDTAERFASLMNESGGSSCC